MRPAITLAAGILVALIGWRAASDEKKPDPKQATADKVAAFEYPGSKRFKEENTGTIAQVIFVTPGELAKVDEWYRKTLGISKDIFMGVADMPWPSGVKATEAKGQQQWSVFTDEMRPKGGAERGVTIRAATTRAYVAKTPEQTVFVVLNRGPDDKHTMVSVVLMPETKR
jgi:hypothetical protein